MESESPNEIKTLFNEIFPSMKGKRKTPDSLYEHFYQLSSLNKNDYIIKRILLYFYPSKKSKEANTDKKFWFEKYKSLSIYTEYNLAIDLLKILKSYKREKKVDFVFDEINKILIKFGKYKNLDYYMLLTNNVYSDTLVHIYSFFLRDIDYFKMVINVNIQENDDLTDQKTLEKIFCGKTISEKELKTHKYYKEKINSLEDKYNNQNNIIIQLLGKVNEMENKLNNNIIEMEEMKEKLNKIYVRDTIKYSIKYIYRVFYSQIENQNSFKKNVHEQILELKSILSKPQFSNLKFLYDFLDAVEFGDLTTLNKASHPTLEKRKFEEIKNVIDNKQPYLDKVVTFLENLPDLNYYINLELTFYLNKQKLEEKISEKYNFNLIYNNYFSH